MQYSAVGNALCHNGWMAERLPSTTARGRRWLANFNEHDQAAARLLLDSLQVATSSEMRFKLKKAILDQTDALRDGSGVLVPVLATEDIHLPADQAIRTGKNGHIAYETFAPGARISATPGSEGFIGNLVREVVQPPSSASGRWMGPSAALEELRQRRCRTVLLVTDYAGSGRQVTRFAQTFTRNPTIRSWRSFGWARIVVLTYAATLGARDAMESCAAIDKVQVIRPAVSFDDAGWTQDERREVERVCRAYAQRGHANEALGYSASGGLFATHESVPNNLPLVLRQLKRSRPGDWRPFFEGRQFPEDLAADLGDYRTPKRELLPIVQVAGQSRLAKAMEAGKFGTVEQRLLVILAAGVRQPQTTKSVAHLLRVTDDTATTLVGFLNHVGWLDATGLTSHAGQSELDAAKRLPRVSTAGLTGSSEAYYPQSLR